MRSVFVLLLCSLLLLPVVAGAEPADGYLIQIDPAKLQRYGLYYPVTYRFKLPAGATALSAQYKYNAPDPWLPLPESAQGTLFNGIDTVRFDYTAGFAYVSIRFSRLGNTVYLYFSDAAGAPVAVQFDGIPKYYDDRKAAVTITLDDWATWSDEAFQKACHYLDSLGLYFTVGLITDIVPWASVQQQLTQLGEKMEIASHSARHSCSAAEYSTNGYLQEIIGSRDAIRANVQYSLSPYVSAYFEPCSYYDLSTDSTVSAGDFLVIRGKKHNYDGPFIPWDPELGRYGHASGTIGTSGRADNTDLQKAANAAFDKMLAAGSVYHLVDHPAQGLWRDSSNLIKHLNYIKGRSDVWYVPLGPMYQYHYVQELRGDLGIKNLGNPTWASSFTTNVTTGRSPLTVAFTDTTPGQNSAWAWDFGDSTSSTEQHPQHVFSKPGSYTVRLTVTGPDGVSTSQSAIVITPPVVEIVSPSTIIAEQPAIQITATLSPDPPSLVTSVDFFSGTTLLGSATTPPYSIVWAGVPAGEYSLTAQVVDLLQGVTTSQPVTVSVRSTTLPPPWLNQDIGNVGAPGNSEAINGIFKVNGAGDDIWGMEDAFHFAFQPLNGDGQIIARVAAIENGEADTKAGLIIREALTPDAAYAMMSVSPGKPANFLRRLNAGESFIPTEGPLPAAAPPYWVKLVRSGNNISGYVSQDGVNWQLVDSDRIRMNGTVYIGLAISSHRYGHIATVTFENVAVTAGVGP